MEKAILTLVINHGNEKYKDEVTVANYIFGAIGNIGLKEKHYQILFEEVKRIYKSNSKDNVEQQLLRHENAAIKNEIVELMASPHHLSEKWFEKFQLIVKTPGFDIQNEVKILMARYSLKRLIEISKENDMKISTTKDFDQLRVLLKLNREYQKEINRLSSISGLVILP